MPQKPETVYESANANSTKPKPASTVSTQRLLQAPPPIIHRARNLQNPVSAGGLIGSLVCFLATAQEAVLNPTCGPTKPTLLRN